MSIKIKNRHRLSDREIKVLQDELKNSYSVESFDAGSTIETGEVTGITIILVDGEIVLMYHGDTLVFTVNGLQRYTPKDKFVVVDKGAVRFVARGADIMAPGIVDADENIIEGDQVWICDEMYHKPLATGIALMNGKQMIDERHGKAVTVIHHIGDTLWNLITKSI